MAIKAYCVGFLFILLVSPAANQAAAEQPVRLSVLSYNIHHGEGIDGKLDLQRIAGVIKSVDPDLVALQEVDKKVKRSDSVDQPAELARIVEMQVVFAANIELQGGHYGNAVLSRYPIVHHHNHLLPRVDNGEQRGLIEAEIQVPRLNAPLLLLATHLDHRPDDRERIASTAVINQRVSNQVQRLALLAGDMNAVPESKVLAEIGTKWMSANSVPQPTVPVGKPVKQIDYILAHPQDRWKVIEFKVLDEAVASDHRAVFSVLELLPQQTR